MKKYIISATEPMGESYGTDIIKNHPEEAIIAWCELNKKYPTCASIQADNEQSAYELLTWADRNKDKLEAYMKKYKCPYKFEWITGIISSYIKKQRSSMQWEYDQVSPFAYG